MGFPERLNELLSQKIFDETLNFTKAKLVPNDHDNKFSINKSASILAI